MKSLCAILLLCVCSLTALARLKKTDGAEYKDLLARVQAGDTSIDFARLRIACLQSPDCSVRADTDQRKRMFQAMRDHNNAAALDAAEKILRNSFISIEAHSVAATVYGANGEAAKAKFHHDVMVGLLKSIINSGDGKSQASAYVVVSTTEEYMTLQALGLPMMGKQALITGNDHAWDLLTRSTPAGEVQVYFNIDAFFPEL